MTNKKESGKKPGKSSRESSKKRPKIDPDDIGVSKEEADEIIAVLNGLSDEEIEKQEREIKD